MEAYFRRVLNVRLPEVESGFNDELDFDPFFLHSFHEMASDLFQMLIYRHPSFFFFSSLLKILTLSWESEQLFSDNQKKVELHLHLLNNDYLLLSTYCWPITMSEI